MSYESDMLEKLAMPTKGAVEEAILKTLFQHNGVIKEFSSGEDIVTELADQFSLSDEQRRAELERMYRQENRIVKSPLWHRLLFRAADTLAKERLVTRPTDTMKLTNKKEWMLTEKGFDSALKLLNLPATQKDILPVDSFEVQKEVNKLKETTRPERYTPFETANRTKVITKTTNIRLRSFRQAVIETYGYKCCICGLKMYAPNSLKWEVEAAHIVPHGMNGKNDIWNGIALCGLHHWAFDVGWFSFANDYRIIVSSKAQTVPDDFGTICGYGFFRNSLSQSNCLSLPENEILRPHEQAIEWHRKNIFYP
jgi:hypothetical protein